MVNINIWIVLGLISAFALGLREVIAKGLFKKYSSPFVIWFFSLSIVFGCFFVPGFTFKVPYDLIFWIIAKGFILILILYFLYGALSMGDISVIMPLTCFVPAFVLFGSTIFLKEILSPIQYFGIVLIVLFSFLLPIDNIHDIYRPKFFKTKAFQKLFLFFIFVMIGYQLDKIIGVQIHPSTYVFYNFIFLVVFFIPYSVEVKKINNFSDFKLFFGIGLVAFISEISYLFAVPFIEISILASVRQLSVIFAAIIGGIIYREQKLGYRIIISVLMFLSILFLV